MLRQLVSDVQSPAEKIASEKLNFFVIVVVFFRYSRAEVNLDDHAAFPVYQLRKIRLHRSALGKYYRHIGDQFCCVIRIKI